MWTSFACAFALAFAHASHWCEQGLIDPLQLAIQVVQNRRTGEQKSHWHKTNKGNYHLKVCNMSFFFVLSQYDFCSPAWRFCTTWMASCKEPIKCFRAQYPLLSIRRHLNMTVPMWYQFHIRNYNKLPRATLSASSLSNRCFWGNRGRAKRNGGESEGTDKLTTPSLSLPPFFFSNLPSPDLWGRPDTWVVAKRCSEHPENSRLPSQKKKIQSTLS